MTRVELKQAAVNYKYGRIEYEHFESAVEEFEKALLQQACLSGSLPKSAEEVAAARNTVYQNHNLTFSYRDDVIAVLDWVLTGEPFDGLDGS